LHVPGVTLGENPWPLVIQQCLVANRFELDDLNWIYWRPYDLRSEAEIMLRDLEAMRESCRTHADPAVRECVEGGHMHFRMLMAHPAVQDAAVVGVPSAAWGESPVAFVVLREAVDPQVLLEWANARLGKMQRLVGIEVSTELPRSEIGKVLKRQLRDGWRGAPV
jgi:hypothetical protein